MWPIVWQFGDFRLGSYGAVIGVGILLCLWMARRLGVRDGLSAKAVNDIGIGVFISGFAGSWLLGVGVNWVRGIPMGWSELRNAGAIHGGLIGGLLGMLLLVRVFRVPLRLLLDAYSPTIALGQAVGRLGCFAAGCCYGKAGGGPLSVVFSNPVAHEIGGVPLGEHLHPVQLYDASAHLMLCLLLWTLHRRGVLRGRLFGLWAIMEGLTRFSIESFRGDLGRGVWFDLHWLSTGRFTAFAFLLVGALFLLLTARAEPAAPAAN